LKVIGSGFRVEDLGSRVKALGLKGCLGFRVLRV
jgi:hypothetical protein